jgi:hypothetical protein
MSGKCSADPDLDGADCHAADQILAIASIVRLVTLQLGGALAAATVCIPRPVEPDRQSVSTAAAVESCIAAIGIGPGLDWDSTVVRPLNWVAKFQSIRSRSTRRLRRHACPTRRFPPPNLHPARRSQGVVYALFSAVATRVAR